MDSPHQCQKVLLTFYTLCVRVCMCVEIITHTHTQTCCRHIKTEKAPHQQTGWGNSLLVFESLYLVSWSVWSLICEWTPPSVNVTLYRVIVGWWFGSGWRRGSAWRRRRAASALQGDEQEARIKMALLAADQFPFKHTHTHTHTHTNSQSAIGGS